MLTATHLERFPWRTRDSCRSHPSHPSAHEKLPLTSMCAFYILLDRKKLMRDVLNSVFVKGVVSLYFLRYKLEIVGGMGPTVGKVRFWLDYYHETFKVNCSLFIEDASVLHFWLIHPPIATNFICYYRHVVISVCVYILRLKCG